MLKQLLQRVTFEVVGIVASAFAAGVAVISAAYALYALLRTSLSAAASAGLTSPAAIILVYPSGEGRGSGLIGYAA